MQKTFVIVALVTLLGLASAATYNTANGTWAINPKVVATTANDSLIVGAGEVRLVSSGDNVLLQGVNGVNVTQKTIATKDLAAKDDKNISITGDNKDAPNQVVAWDTRISADKFQDPNGGVQQVNVTKYKLNAAGNANSNPQTITSWKNNNTVLTIVPGSATVVPGSKKYYVAALVQENSTATVGTLFVVGVDISGTATSVAALTTNAPLTGAQVSIAGIAGTKSLWVIWTQNATDLVAGKVDPSKNVTDGDIRDVAKVAAGQILRAWSTSTSYGHIVQVGNSLSLQSNTNNNWTTVAITLQDVTTLTILPKNDNLALIYSNANKDLNLQLVAGNGTVTGPTNLLTGGSALQVFQHNDGSVYVLDVNTASDINVGQVWGNTHLAASTLHAAVYACIALVAALFVF